MKHFFSVSGLLGLALLAAGISSAEAQAPKLGYINSQRLVAEAPGAAEAQKAFETDMTGLRSQVDALGKELERLQTDYQKQEATLSAAAKQQRQQEIQQRFRTSQDSVAKLEQRAAQRQQQLSTTMKPIMERIDAAIEAIRKEGGYAIIFDAGSSGMVAADPALDITDRVVARLKTGR